MKNSELIVSTILALSLSCLSWSGATGSESDAHSCAGVAGTWRTTYSGISSAGELQEGNLTVSISKDCSFKVEKEILFPFIDSTLVSGSSLAMRNNKISGEADLGIEDCSTIYFSGSIESDDGKCR